MAAVVAAARNHWCTHSPRAPHEKTYPLALSGLRGARWERCKVSGAQRASGRALALRRTRRAFGDGQWSVENSAVGASNVSHGRRGARQH
eukprot:scaffold273524_cov31-Tisochrysis_lutea.AAC.4